MKIVSVPRESDERVLGWLSMRVRGQSLSRIARRAGGTPAGIASATNHVADADMAHDPQAAGAYPWRAPK